MNYMSGNFVLIFCGYYVFLDYGIFGILGVKFNYFILCFVYLEDILVLIGVD